MEKLDEIKIYLNIKLKNNIRNIINYNLYEQSQLLTTLILNVCTQYNVYAHFKFENNILTIYFSQFTLTKYKETLIINLNKFIRQYKLNTII